jgi:hypothetical protein
VLASNIFRLSANIFNPKYSNIYHFIRILGSYLH